MAIESSRQPVPRHHGSTPRRERPEVQAGWLNVQEWEPPALTTPDDGTRLSSGLDRLEARIRSMRYRHLGKSGLRVSELAMGTQTFGWGVDERTAHRMADQFVDSGGNLFDTASSYNSGASESMLGSWLTSRKNRDATVVATKVFFSTGSGPNDLGLSRKHILQSAEESLRRLQTDYIDLYQAHCCDALHQPRARRGGNQVARPAGLGRNACRDSRISAGAESLGGAQINARILTGLQKGG